jgi:hypothetical protein
VTAPQKAVVVEATKIAGIVIVLVVVFLGVRALVGWASDPLGLHKNDVPNATHAAAASEGKAVVAAAGQAAAADGVAIIDRARARDTSTGQIREANHAALLAAPGANMRLDPDFIARLNAGMCRYAASAGDPGCDRLPGGDPPFVP